MVPPKKKSKRVPVRLRHKIEKRVNAKARKLRKEAKKHPELHRKKKQEKLNIPNSFPYKDRLLAEIEEEKRRKAEEALKRKEETPKKKLEVKAEENDAQEDEEVLENTGSEDEFSNENGMEENGGDLESADNSMAALLASARARAAEYEATNTYKDSDDNDDDAMDEDEDDFSNLMNDAEDKDSTMPTTGKDTSRKAYGKMFKQVLDMADVILYVLDARDPMGTRSKEVEQEVMAADGGQKRLILILNKIDLVPPAVLRGWLQYLRKFFPALPLKATTSAANARTFDHKSLTMQSTSATLFKALKTYANAKDLKRSILVGVIGYPNVGKSSVINALTSRVGGKMSACPTGAEAGVTTSLREVKLDKKLKLIDSPGIVFPGSSGERDKISKSEHARLILLNAVPQKQILDPISAVNLLLKRLATSKALFQKLLGVYNVAPLLSTSSKDLVNDFLVQVARKRGRLGKGGIPNVSSAAQAVIMDWRDGRIQGWVDPPISTADNELGQGIKAQDVQAASTTDEKVIVTEWAKEFKLEGLWEAGDYNASDDDPMALE